MTRNQIEFLKHLETKRSNIAGERETARANLERERQGTVQLTETERHNRAIEQVQVGQLDETRRHNTSSEQISFLGLQEQQRANQAREAIQNRANDLTLRNIQENERANRSRELLTSQQLAEQSRANMVREAETSRANRASESLRATELGIRQQEADTHRSALNEQISLNSRNLEQRQRELDEVVRSNQAREIETNRANLAREQEQHRSNVANEVIGTANQVTNAGRLAETVRSDLAREAENTRHNLASESILALKDFSTKVIAESPDIQLNTGSPTLSLPDAITLKEPSKWKETRRVRIGGSGRSPQYKVTYTDQYGNVKTEIVKEGFGD